MNKYIVIIVLYTTTGFVCGMEEYKMENLLKKGFISSVAVNDYIVPVSTFSQALKKEASLTRTCLMNMKKMWSDQILSQNLDCRLMMYRSEKYVITVDDVRHGNETYEYLKNFHSKNICISYYGNNVRIKILPMLYLVSSRCFAGKKLKPIDFTINHLSDALQKKWDKICDQRSVRVIELSSDGNMSSWIRVERIEKNDYLKD